jgi:hypothetical protein
MCEHGEHHRHQDCGCGERHEKHHEGGCECGASGARAFRPHHHGDSCRCACGCHADPWSAEHTFWRRFATREERIAWLERYLKELRAEAQAVEERITELKAQS